MKILRYNQFGALFHALKKWGYRIIGPVTNNGTIVYDCITRDADLPRGVTDDTAPGHYGLSPTAGRARFAWHAPSNSPRQYLFPPRVPRFHMRQDENPPRITAPAIPVRTALIGIRPCDLAAIRSLDTVLLDGPHPDPDYRMRREATFIVAVNCNTLGATCFCKDTGTGPRAHGGYDVLLTEYESPNHVFSVETGSERGENFVSDLPVDEGSPDLRDANDPSVASECQSNATTLSLNGVGELLAESFDSPLWDEIADQCTTCGNCTMVCPTCFCHRYEETSSLDGTEVTRSRVWDTCFSQDYSALHSGAIRISTKSRYRNWITHKLGTWAQQFDSPGCVGCGRCIAWCPVGIDLTGVIRDLRRRRSPML